MIDQSIKTNRMIGMVQPKGAVNTKIPELFRVGCMGKISSFNETDDGRYDVIRPTKFFRPLRHHKIKINNIR